MEERLADMPYKDTTLRAEARRRYERRNPGRRTATRHAARAKRRAEHYLEFVGVDGEGVDRPNGTHEYVLLSVGDESLYHPVGDRLTTRDIFTFLWEQFDPKVTYVGFFLGYDFAHWLRDLPEHRARMLLTEEGRAVRMRKRSGGNRTPFPVQWQGWEFDLLANKRFKLRPEGEKQWLYVCDAGSFFQSSFLKAIDPDSWPEPVCTDAEYAAIVEGKAARGDETVAYGTPVDPAMIRYNRTENRVLAKLLARLNEGLTAMDVRLSKTQWYGPGQAAQRWLRSTAPAHTGEDIRAAAPEAVHEAAQASYYGGWFEIVAHGPVPGTVYEYDINSAYPAVIARLPCLLHGTWQHNKNPRSSAPWRLVRADVAGSDPFLGPMPHRDPQGGVQRPRWTSGWHWAHELEASRRAGLVDRVKVHEAWTYRPCDCAPPFRAMADLYAHRLRVGKGTPQGKATKLVYNSSYGKFAQSVGMPEFGNAVYASLITAGCRTLILDAIATHPERSAAVVMIATDGVYFTSEHPSLDIDPQRLGAWDMQTKSNLTLFKPGVYWDDKTREALATGSTKLGIRSRGVNERALAQRINEIDQQWGDLIVKDDPMRQYERAMMHDNWPSIELVIPFGIISPRLALHRNKWELCGAVVHDQPNVQSSWPHPKRNPMWAQLHDDGVFRSAVPANEDHEPSTPYDRRFGAMLDDIALQMPAHPDGNLDLLFAEVLRLA